MKTGKYEFNARPKNLNQAMSSSITVELAGEAIELYPQRALFWPTKQALIIADLHLAKDTIFRRNGIAVPNGSNATDLEKLDALIAQTFAKKIIILGDVVHAKLEASDPAFSLWHQWREKNSAIDIIATTGNHDRGMPLDELRIDDAGEKILEPPFLFTHEPAQDKKNYVLAGHLHPRAGIDGVTRRWPAFWFTDRIGVLPAFTTLAGGYSPKIGKNDQIFLCVEDIIIAHPDNKNMG